MDPKSQHAYGGTAAVVGGVLMAAASVCRVMFESEGTIHGLGTAGGSLIAIGLIFATMGMHKNYESRGGGGDAMWVHTLKLVSAALFIAIAIWTMVRMLHDPVTENVSGFKLAPDGFCGRDNSTKLYLDPAFMDVGAAGNSVVDILFSILMMFGMSSYYGPLAFQDRDDKAEKMYIKIAYVLLCVASLANVFLCIFTRIHIGHDSPFDNTDTRIKAISHYRVAVMGLIALQLSLAGALSITSKKSKDGDNSFFSAEPNSEPGWIVVTHRVLQFLFATSTFVGAVVLAFATGAFHSEHPTVSVAGNMLCRSETAYDQVATGTSLFAFLLPYMLSAWWDMTKV